MRINRLTVGGFGVLRPGLDLELAPGLNLVLAPNEAGKTTLAEFITCLLYGFGKRQGGRRPFDPWQGGETGGEMAYALEPGGKTYTIVRHVLKNRDQLKVTGHNGRKADLMGMEPGQAHTGLSRGAFLTVSRIELNDLQNAFSGSGATLRQAEQQLKGFFFQEAATRGQTANPLAVKQAWEGRASELHHPHRKRGKADNEILQDLGRAARELSRARALQEQAAALQAREGDLQARSFRAGERAQKAKADLDLAKAGRERSRLCARWLGLKGEAKRLSELGLAKGEALRIIVEHQNEVKRLEEQLAGSREQAEKFSLGAGDYTSLEEVRKAEGESGALEARLTDLARRQGELAAFWDQHNAESQALAHNWAMGAEALAQLPEGLPADIKNAQQALAHAEEAENEARRLWADAKKNSADRSWLMPLGLAGFGLGLFLGLFWHWAEPGDWAAQAGAAAFLAGAAMFLWSRMGGGGRRDAESARQAFADQAALTQAARMSLAALAEPRGLEPGQVDPDRLAQALARAKALAEKADRLKKKEQALGDDTAAVSQALSDLGAPRADDPWAALSGLRKGLAEAARNLEQAKGLAGENQKKLLAIDGLRKKCQELLGQAGFESVSELEAAHLRARQAEKLEAQMAELEAQMGDEPLPGKELSPEEARENLALAQKHADEAEAEVARLAAELGACRQALSQIGQEPGPGLAQARLDALTERRWELAREHTRLLLSLKLLEEAMDEFRLQSQPSLLKGAAAYMASASRGAYQWLGSGLFDPKGKTGISVRAGQGRAEHNAAELSRGTRDQIYLCLRLALADEITAQAQPVPLILDDPLVNMDDERLKAVLQMLAKVSEKRQVLLLTCHSGQAEVLKEVCGIDPLRL